MISSAGNRGPPSTLPYYLNEHNTTYWRRSNGVRILGFGFYRPDRQPFEQFYYHHLILHRPFRNLDEFISEGNDEGTYERQCQIGEVFGDEDSATKHMLATVDKDLRRQKVREEVHVQRLFTSITQTARWYGTQPLLSLRDALFHPKIRFATTGERQLRKRLRISCTLSLLTVACRNPT